jgi:hypothetical protein
LLSRIVWVIGWVATPLLSRIGLVLYYIFMLIMKLAFFLYTVVVTLKEFHELMEFLKLVCC